MQTHTVLRLSADEARHELSMWVARWIKGESVEHVAEFCRDGMLWNVKGMTDTEVIERFAELEVGKEIVDDDIVEVVVEQDTAVNGWIYVPVWKRGLKTEALTPEDVKGVPGVEA